MGIFISRQAVPLLYHASDFRQIVAPGFAEGAAVTARQTRPPVRPAAARQIWLRAREVRRLTGWSEGHIRRLGREKRLAARLSKSRGRNGKREREYDLCSLSEAAQIK